MPQHHDSLICCPAVWAARMFLGAVICSLAMSHGALAHVDPWPRDSHQPLLVGSVGLAPCPDSRGLCGRVDRALDPTGAVPGRIGIHFEYYPHSAKLQSSGTIVATEGGPGYPATLSRDEYLALFRPLLAQHDFLIMDNRGTGQSGAIDCHELQTAEQWTVESTARCGESLGARAPLYSTAYAADDLAAILEALGVQRIDLYGDSYGTYFEQVFALRHPNSLRSIVLDGAYPLNGPDYPWYPSYAPAMRDKFNIACRRFAPCAALPGTSIDHIQPLLDQLRAQPARARAPDSDGRQREFMADASKLAIVMYGSAPSFATVRELDAAARAFIAGDKLPALRLMAETTSAVDSRDPSADPTQWSAGLAAAVMCQDPPQIFDMRLAPGPRLADRERVISDRKRLHPDTYAPFLIDEYRGMPLDYSFIDQCVGWPPAPASHPASTVAATDARYPDIPALIISGELDNLTTLSDGAAVAAAFKHGRQIKILNSFHVNALPHARSECGADLVRRFVATLSPGDTSCAATVPPLRLVPRFALRASELEPAAAMSGNKADAAQLRRVSATVATVGDVLARLGANSTGQGVGLRGGSFRVVTTPSSVQVSLDHVKWTEDAPITGEIHKPVARTGVVRAQLQMAAPQGPPAELTVQWREGTAGATASIHGSIDGVAVRAQTPAP